MVTEANIEQEVNGLVDCGTHDTIMQDIFIPGRVSLRRRLLVCPKITLLRTYEVSF